MARADAPRPKGEIVVFAGPTLPAQPDAGWRRLLAQVRVVPPAQRGDVLTALCREPSTLVILDGYYYSVPAVTHKELLYALESGVRVIGASSMGALRAAELESFGMEGVGGVFEAFRDGVLDGDDEVAVMHASAEHGFRSMTVALVDVRHVLEQWVKAGQALREEADAVIAAIKALPFTERHGSRVRQLAEKGLAQGSGPGSGARLMADLSSRSLKQNDARLAILAALDEAPARDIPAGTGATVFHGFFCEWHLSLGGEGSREEQPSFLDAWNAIQILHPEAPALVAGLRRRFLLATVAASRRLEPSKERVAELEEALVAHLVGLHGEPLLPVLERRAEATAQARADLAEESFGTAEDALGGLAKSYGLPREKGEENLLQLLAKQEDLMPSWCLARAGACCAAFVEARAVAADVRQLYHAFQVWSQGSTVERRDLESLGARLWSCSLDDVVQRAAERGLYESRGFSPGLWPALQLFAPAEGLREPLNDYSHHRQALAAAELRDPWPRIAPRVPVLA